MEFAARKETLFGREKILGLDMSKRSRRWLVKGALLFGAVTAVVLAVVNPHVSFGYWAANVVSETLEGGFLGFALSKILQPDLQDGKVVRYT